MSVRRCFALSAPLLSALFLHRLRPAKHPQPHPTALCPPPSGTALVRTWPHLAVSTGPWPRVAVRSQPCGDVGSSGEATGQLPALRRSLARMSTLLPAALLATVRPAMDRSDAFDESQGSRRRNKGMLSLGSSGLSLPVLGFGVGTSWFDASKQGRQQELEGSVMAALDAGFTRIDEAEVYKNEATTGRVLRSWLDRTGTPRENLFITSKVMNCDDGIKERCRVSLETLGCRYFDLYLMHGPFHPKLGPFKRPLPELWSDMEALLAKGLVKSIGVSNWRVRDFDAIWETARTKPCCNQIERHPYLQQPELARWCRAHQVEVMAYAPLAPITKLPGGPVDGPVKEIAARHGCTPAQTLLRWALQTGGSVVTTTSKPARLQEYLGALDVELLPQEVAQISAAGASAPPQRLFWKTL